MKQINTSSYNNNTIKALISKNIITITAKTIKLLNYPEEKNQKH